MSTSITDLPAELMLEVGQHLLLIDPHHCLLSYLSQTCRWFHNIFTQFIVAYHTRTISENLIPQGFVNIATEPNTSTFSLNGDFKEISFKLRGHTLNDIRCFRNLIFRANTISRIKLMSPQQATGQVLACLLNSCVRRPDLHLKIEGNWGISWIPFDGEHFAFNTLSNSTASPPLPVKTKWKDILLGALNALSSKRCHKSAKRNTSPQVIPRDQRFEVPSPKFAPGLTGLWIEGDCLFNAKTYTWIRDIMNAAPLTHLSITKSNITPNNWSQILSSITIPTLAYFQIGRVSVAFLDLLDFFSRHPSLQEINLSVALIGIVSFLSSSTRTTKLKLLPKLKTLIATPEYIYPFICHQQDGYFNDLNAYDIRPFLINYTRHYVEDYFRSIFELLASDRRRIHQSIILSWKPLNILITWFSRRAISVPRIWKIVLNIGGPFFKVQLLEERTRVLLAQRAKKMKKIAFINDLLSWQNERLVLDRLFHIIFPNLQVIEYKGAPGLSIDDWSMIT
jgi:hypothetical protein